MYKNRNLNYITILLALFLALLFVSCSSEESNPSEPSGESDLVGSWKQTSLSWNGATSTGFYTLDELNNLNIVWDLTFNADYTAKQVKSIGSTLETQTGTWSVSGDLLALTLKSNSTDDVDKTNYQCDMGSNSLRLSWTLQTGTEFTAGFTKQ